MVTMCTGAICPLKLKCYRYRAVPVPGQKWFKEPPYRGGKCDEYYELKTPSHHDGLKRNAPGPIRTKEFNLPGPGSKKAKTAEGAS